MSGCDDLERRGLDIIRKHVDHENYVARYPDIDPNLVDPTEHYFVFGWREGRDPSQNFSTRKYLNEYQDVKLADICPLEHYLVYGEAENRRAWPVQDVGPRRLMVDEAATLIDDLDFQHVTKFQRKKNTPPIHALGCVDTYLS